MAWSGNRFGRIALGVIGIALCGAVTWSALSGEPAKPPVTVPLLEGNHIKTHARVDGVPFNIPLSYLYRGYDKKVHGWPNVSREIYEGREAWLSVDFINIQVYMPKLESLNENTVNELSRRGWGEKVMVHLTHFHPWDFYFKHTLPLEQALPESPKMPGMHHYFTRGYRDIYLSHTHSTSDLTRVSCYRQSHWKLKSPSCTVTTAYRPAPDIMAVKGMEGAVYRLEYDFSDKYLPEWRRIDKQLKSIFDQFIREAIFEG